MRVLIIRPEREATALATALAERGHTPVIAPLFRLEFLHPPAEFSAALAACQAVLLTSANGARALGRGERAARPADPGGGRHHGQHGRGAGLQRRHLGGGRWRGPGRAGAPAPRPQGRPPAARVGPRGRGRPRRAAAAGGLRGEALRALRRARGDRLAGVGARGAGGARARRRHLLLAARGVGVRHAWSRMRAWPPPCTTSPPSPSARPRSRRRPACRSRRWWPPSGRAARPCSTRSTDWPKPLYKDSATMSDTSEPVSAALTGRRRRPPTPVVVRRGLGVVGAFVVGVLAAVIVLAGALISLPFWPQPGARPVARPCRGDPAGARHRPAGGARRRHRRRHRRRRYGTPRPHGAAGRSREAPARGLGDGGRAANGARRSRSRHRRLEEPRRSAGAAPRRQRRGAGTRSGPEQRRGRKGDRRPDARDRGPAHHAGRARPGRRHASATRPRR